MRRISEAELRRLVRKVLEGHPGGEVWEPAVRATNVSAVVDPQEDDSCPGNPGFVPHDKVELSVAVRNITKGLPDERVPDIYRYIRDALRSEKERAGEDTKMKGKTSKRSAVEEAIRREVRRYLAEAGPGAEFHGTDFYGEPSFDEEQEQRRRRRTRKFNVVDDVDGASFEELARELGLSVSGAKRFVDQALQKARFAGTMDQDELEVLTLVAMKDYIQMLQSSGELTPADVQLLMDHPDIIRDLSGFREHLHQYIRYAQRRYADAGLVDDHGRVKGHGKEVD